MTTKQAAIITVILTAVGVVVAVYFGVQDSDAPVSQHSTGQGSPNVVNTEGNVSISNSNN